MLEAYAREARKRFVDSGEDLTDLPTLDDQDALVAGDDEVVGAGQVVLAVPTVGNDVSLDVKEDDGSELECAVGLDEVKLV